VFHLNNEVDSEFQDIINYLVRSKFPDHFTREEKEVFQRKVAPYSLIKGILFKLGADEQLRRYLGGSDRKKVIESLHSDSSRGTFRFCQYGKPDLDSRILVAVYEPGC
jgi:hypothetical protein